MARIVHTGDTPGKRRRRNLRSAAEALRLLAGRPTLADGLFDAEARDVAAFLVFCLREIGAAIESAAQSWDDKNYWRKSEKLRADWRWAPQAADRLAPLLTEGRWTEVTPELIGLIPHLDGITIEKETRDADWWCGAYRALQREAKRAATA